MRAPTLLALMPLALAILAAAPPGDDAPQPLAAAIPSGPAKDAVTRLLKPYAQATATELGTPTWDASLDGLKALFAAHDAELALVDGPTLAAGCKAQVFEKLNWAGLGRDRFLAEAASDCGAGAYVSTTILAWDNQKLQGTPGWVDFWDVTKHPGRRGLYKGARGNLEIALLADGVAAADVYRTLRTSEGVDRAFRKLDQLKPYIVWWDQPSQPAQLLASAKVLMTTAPAASLATNASPADAGTQPHAASPPASHVGLQWVGSLTEITSWVIAKNSPHLRGAMAAITIATDPAREADFAKATGLGPSTHAGFALLPTGARPRNPSQPANLQAGLAIDEGFWLDNGAKLEARFAAWVGK